jgi:hypothetical protein
MIMSFVVAESIIVKLIIVVHIVFDVVIGAEIVLVGVEIVIVGAETIVVGSTDISILVAKIGFPIGIMIDLIIVVVVGVEIVIAEIERIIAIQSIRYILE